MEIFNSLEKIKSAYFKYKKQYGKIPSSKHFVNYLEKMDLKQTYNSIRRLINSNDTPMIENSKIKLFSQLRLIQPKSIFEPDSRGNIYQKEKSNTILSNHINDYLEIRIGEIIDDINNQNIRFSFDLSARETEDFFSNLKYKKPEPISRSLKIENKELKFIYSNTPQVDRLPFKIGKSQEKRINIVDENNLNAKDQKNLEFISLRFANYGNLNNSENSIVKIKLERSLHNRINSERKNEKYSNVHDAIYLASKDSNSSWKALGNLDDEKYLQETMKSLLKSDSKLLKKFGKDQIITAMEDIRNDQKIHQSKMIPLKNGFEFLISQGYSTQDSLISELINSRRNNKSCLRIQINNSQDGDKRYASFNIEGLTEWGIINLVRDFYQHDRNLLRVYKRPVTDNGTIPNKSPYEIDDNYTRVRAVSSSIYSSVKGISDYNHKILGYVNDPGEKFLDEIKISFLNQNDILNRMEYVIYGNQELGIEGIIEKVNPNLKEIYENFYLDLIDNRSNYNELISSALNEGDFKDIFKMDQIKELFGFALTSYFKDNPDLIEQKLILNSYFSVDKTGSIKTRNQNSLLSTILTGDFSNNQVSMRLNLFRYRGAAQGIQVKDEDVLEMSKLMHHMLSIGSGTGDSVAFIDFESKTNYLVNLSDPNLVFLDQLCGSNFDYRSLKDIDLSKVHPRIHQRQKSSQKGSLKYKHKWLTGELPGEENNNIYGMQSYYAIKIRELLYEKNLAEIFPNSDDLREISNNRVLLTEFSRRYLKDWPKLDNRKIISFNSDTSKKIIDSYYSYFGKRNSISQKDLNAFRQLVNTVKDDDFF
ncbi:MAG: hypothetical protein INQ03_25880 [Candidatus Heimdallarchaeota archaeon]|nr:hypothetical protein [Candidatus Heimdallarchaeota archaeon]